MQNAKILERPVHTERLRKIGRPIPTPKGAPTLNTHCNRLIFTVQVALRGEFEEHERPAKPQMSLLQRQQGCHLLTVWHCRLRAREIPYGLVCTPLSAATAVSAAALSLDGGRSKSHRNLEFGLLRKSRSSFNNICLRFSCLPKPFLR